MPPEYSRYNMLIHCHAYRQDEIHAMMELGNEVGCTFDVFIHVLEGYKVAAEMKQHGAMATTFSDWWAYKMEAYDAIPYNGALMREQGVLVSFNSDSVELARRMNTEAAKAVKYGGVPPEEALKFVTWNAARHLCLESRLGSLEPGKEADFVIWSHSPLSPTASVSRPGSRAASTSTSRRTESSGNRSRPNVQNWCRRSSTRIAEPGKSRTTRRKNPPIPIVPKIRADIQCRRVRITHRPAVGTRPPA
jgi:hypothetical protein